MQQCRRENVPNLVEGDDAERVRSEPHGETVGLQEGEAQRANLSGGWCGPRSADGAPRQLWHTQRPHCCHPLLRLPCECQPISFSRLLQVKTQDITKCDAKGDCYSHVARNCEARHIRRPVRVRQPRGGHGKITFKHLISIITLPFRAVFFPLWHWQINTFGVHV